jgi:hypothetical protein
MSWHDAIDLIRPHVVKIEHPGGHGTGFLAFHNASGDWCGIATAAHVVAHADAWQQPIKIIGENGVPRFLAATERVIFLDHINDSAVVLFFKGDFQLPEVPIALMPMDEPCRIGTDVGWLGYPGIEPNTPCFFSGAVSARQGHRHAYLIDGVSIHGVSGGPVFHCVAPGEVQIIGCITAYHVNRATGEALPGLCVAQDVSHFQNTATHIQSVDEANARKREFEAAQQIAVLGDSTQDALADAAREPDGK